MALPPAHMLVGAAVGELSPRPGGLARWQAWAAGACIALLPDVDTMVRFAVGGHGGAHGTWSHSIVAVIAITGIAGLFGGRRWALLAGAAFASHLLVDLLRAGATSVHLAWPLSDRPADGIYPLFPTVPFESGGGLFGEAPQLHGSRPLARLIQQTLVGAAIFAVALLVGNSRKRPSARRRSGYRSRSRRDSPRFTPPRRPRG